MLVTVGKPVYMYPKPDPCEAQPYRVNAKPVRAREAGPDQREPR